MKIDSKGEITTEKRFSVIFSPISFPSFLDKMYRKWTEREECQKNMFLPLSQGLKIIFRPFQNFFVIFIPFSSNSPLDWCAMLFPPPMTPTTPFILHTPYAVFLLFYVHFFIAIHCFKLRNSPWVPLCHVVHLQQQQHYQEKTLDFFLRCLFVDDFLIYFYRSNKYWTLLPAMFPFWLNKRINITPSIAVHRQALCLFNIPKFKHFYSITRLNISFEAMPIFPVVIVFVYRNFAVK